MPMEFLDNLNKDQAEFAGMIIAKAKQMGVDPRLALTLAYRESGLNPKAVGTSGEIGLMQVMPPTSKQYGFDPKLLSDPQKNIEIGLTILKSNLNKFNDPYLAVAAYNAGENHPYFTNPDEKPLPDTTKTYLKDILAMGGFSSFTDQSATPAVDNRGLPMSQPPEPTATPEPTMKEEFEKRVPGFVGAGAGAATASTLAVGQKAKSAMDLLGRFMEAQTAAAKQVPISGVNVPAPGMPGAAPSMGGLPPPTGPLSNAPAGGRMTQNWIKAQDALNRYADVGQQARDQAEAHKMKQAAMAAEDKIRQIAPEMAQDPNRAGLFVPQQTGSGPRGARTVPINQPPSYSLLDDAIEKLGNIAKGGLRIVSTAPVAGALGGYGGAMSGVEAYEREKAGDRPGAVTAGLGTLQALAAIPHPMTQGLGLTAGIASPLGLAILDRIRKIKAEPTVEPSAEEMETAQRPAFRYARP